MLFLYATAFEKTFKMKKTGLIFFLSLKTQTWMCENSLSQYKVTLQTTYLVPHWKIWFSNSTHPSPTGHLQTFVLFLQDTLTESWLIFLYISNIFLFSITFVVIIKFLGVVPCILLSRNEGATPFSSACSRCTSAPNPKKASQNPLPVSDQPATLHLPRWFQGILAQIPNLYQTHPSKLISTACPNPLQISHLVPPSELELKYSKGPQTLGLTKTHKNLIAHIFMSLNSG